MTTVSYTTPEVISSHQSKTCFGQQCTVIYYYNGVAWSLLNPEIVDSVLFNVWGLSPNDIFFVGYDYSNYEATIIHKHDEEWSEVYRESEGFITEFSGIWGSSKKDIYVVGYDYAIPYLNIYHYDGDSWNLLDVYDDRMCYSLWGSGSDDVFAVGEEGIIMHFDGDSWSPMYSKNRYNLWAVWGTSADNVYAVGDTGTILHYTGCE